MDDLSPLAPDGFAIADRIAALRQVTGLSALDDDVLAEIAAQARLQSLPSGTQLIRQGDSATALYLVVSGRFRVSHESGIIAAVGSGEPIGELAFFAGGQRTANVTAMRDSRVLALDRAGYDAIAARHPELSAGIIAVMAGRLAALTARAAPLPPQSGRIIALTGAADRPLPDALEEGLRRAAKRRGGIDVHSVEDAPVKAGAAALAEWLRRLEGSGRRQILILRDPAACPVWTKFVAGSSDSLAVAAPLKTPLAPRPGTMETRASTAGQLHGGAGVQLQHLILWRDHAAQPISGTPAWLEGRQVALHHHLALDCAADFDRLMRFFCDAARGLVLAGGGAFGTAHLGAYQAMTQAGFEVDFVGGTSVGAAMAAAIAKGLPPEESMRRCNDIFVTSRAMGRLTAPLYSVLNHRVFDAQLQKHFGDQPVEDSPLNYFAVASSLSRNAPHVIRSGPLWQAVRASGSIPALMPPVLSDAGEVLIDGGLFDNLPLGVMRQLKAGPNIALDFRQGRDWRVKADYGALPGPLRAAAGLIFGRAARPAAVRRFPRNASVLSRAMTMNSRRLIEQTEWGDDILIELPVVPGASFLDWTRGQAHYNAAHQALATAIDYARQQREERAPPGDDQPGDDHSGLNGDLALSDMRAAASLLQSASRDSKLRDSKVRDSAS